MTESDIYVSYAWKDVDQGRIVDELDSAWEARYGFKLKRDNREIGYAQSIRSYMDRLAAGAHVVLILSDNYLKSDYCMYELLGIYESPNFRKRVFPILLPGTRIDRPEDHAAYRQFWEGKFDTLDALIKGLRDLSHVAPLIDQLEGRKKCKDVVLQLLRELSDMRALAVHTHTDHSFTELMDWVQQTAGDPNCLLSNSRSDGMQETIGGDRSSVVNGQSKTRRAASTFVAEQDPPIVDEFLEPPVAHEAIDRPELSKTLCNALKEHSILVVGGMSGSGKTYLAASCIRDHAGVSSMYKRVLWYDPSPNESVDSLLVVLEESLKLSGESMFSRCKALAAQLRNSEALLVIDNFHTVDQVSYAVLVSALSISTTPCHLLLLSQAYVAAIGANADPHHIQLLGLGISESQALLKKRGLVGMDDLVVTELLRKTGGLPFAVALFALLVTEFGYDPNELLEGAIESASRIRIWFDKIVESLDKDTRMLLSHLALLDVPFNIGVVKAIGRGLSLANVDVLFEFLQRRFLVSRHTQYRWSVHELLRVLLHPLMSSDQVSKANGLLGLYFLRGISRRPSALLEADEFLSKVRAFRFLMNCTEKVTVAKSVLEEIVATAKMQGHYELFIELSRAVVCINPRDRPWLTYHHAHCALILGRIDYCLNLVKPLLQDSKVITSPQLRLSCIRLYAEALGSLDQPTTAVVALKDAIQSTPDAARNSRPYVQARSTFSWLLCRCGLYAESAELARELLAEAQRKKDIRSGAVGWARLGIAQLRLQDLANASASLDSAKNLFISTGDRRGTAWACVAAAECSLTAGEMPQAEMHLREGAAIASSIGECSIDLQESLKRMLALSPSAPIEALIVGEQHRIRQQMTVKLPPLPS